MAAMPCFRVAQHLILCHGASQSALRKHSLQTEPQGGGHKWHSSEDAAALGLMRCACCAGEDDAGEQG